MITIKEENLEQEIYNKVVSKVIPSPIESKKMSIKPNGDSTMNSNEFQQEFQMKAKSKEVKSSQKKKKLPITTRQISEVDRLNAPLLGLEEQGDTDILNHNKIMINAGGLLGGREANDGVTYFSIPSLSPNSKNDTLKPIDYTLNIRHSIIQDIDYLFLIYFRQETKDYHIKFSDNIGDANNEIFLHLFDNMEIPINKSEVLSLGKILLQVVPNSKNNSIKLINLNEEDKAISTKIFNSTLQEITIGRSNKCSFCLENEIDISKIQCTLYYSQQRKAWVLIDGSKTKPSTNGSWLVASHSYPLYDDIELEIFSNVIKIKYY